MNDLYLQDNQKPIKVYILSQLPRTLFEPIDENMAGAAENSPSAAATLKADKSDIECSVCISKYEEGEEILTLTCFHKFHSSCIETWFNTQNWCPVCRTKLEQESIEAAAGENN